jgi:hypothetical protein
LNPVILLCYNQKRYLHDYPMSKYKEKFNLAKTILAVFVLLAAGVFSSQFNTEKKTFSARAEYDGTFCNDDIGDTLNSSGSTSFLINCWGKLNRNFTYVLFWCPEKSKGATYCGDLRDINSNQAQVIDRDNGSSLTSYMRKSTDKTCGCVQWDVGVGGATGQEGVAGGAIMCAPQPCNQNPAATPTSAPQPTAAQPTTVNTPTAKPPSPDDCGEHEQWCPQIQQCSTKYAACPWPTPTLQSCYPGQTRCPRTNKCVDFQDECTPTQTPTPTTKVCPNNGYNCPGTSLCVPSRVECDPTSTPTRTPTPTTKVCPNNGYNCPGTSLCVPSRVECDPTSTPTRTPTPIRTSPTPTARAVTGTPTQTPAPRAQVVVTQTTIYAPLCDTANNLFVNGCIMMEDVYNNLFPQR